MSADATVKFGADMRELMRGIAQGQSGISGFKSGALSAFGDIGAGITGLGTLASGISGVFSSVAGSVAGLGSFVAESLIAPAASMEQLEVAFGVLLKSTDEAKEHLAALVNYSASTPFALDDIAQASKTLLAFGFTGDDAVDIVSKLGDVAAMTGGSLSDMANILGKVKATGGMDAEVANMLSERAIDVRGELAKLYDLTGEEVVKQMSEKAFGLADLLKVLKKVTGEGGTFEKGAARAAETTLGVWSTFLDNLKLAGADLGASMSESVKPILNEFIGFIQEMKPTLTSLGQVLGDYFTDIGKWLMGLVGDFVENRFTWQARLEVGLETLADVVQQLAAAVRVVTSYVGNSGGNLGKQLAYDGASLMDTKAAQIVMSAVPAGGLIASMMPWQKMADAAAYASAGQERKEKVTKGEDVGGEWLPWQLRKDPWSPKVSARERELMLAEQAKKKPAPKDEEVPSLQADSDAPKVELLDYHAKKITETQEEIAKQQALLSEAQKKGEWELLSLTEKRAQMMREMVRVGASGGMYEDHVKELEGKLENAGSKLEAQQLAAVIKEAKELEAVTVKAREASVMRGAELAALEAEAKGYDKKAEAIKKSIALLNREKELMAQGVSQAKAQSLALRELKAQEAISIKQAEQSAIMSRLEKQQMVNAPTVRIGGLGGRVMAGGSSELSELQAQTTSLKTIERYARQIDGKVGKSSTTAVMV